MESVAMKPGTFARRRIRVLVGTALVLSPLIGVLGGCRRTEAQAEAPAQEPPRPNIIFILVDTLRADRLGCYGHPGGLTPFMDELAAEGVLFEHVIAPSSWTLPSVASLFTAFYPSVHGVTATEEQIVRMNRGNFPAVVLLDERFVTLAERLEDAGYQAAAFVSNPLVQANFGFGQGFDHYDASFGKLTARGDSVSAAALRWLKERKSSKPFFLYLHYMDVHKPYYARAEYLKPLLEKVERRPDKRRLTALETRRHGSYLRSRGSVTKDLHQRLSRYADYWQARYEGGVQEVDAQLRALRDSLVQLGVWNDAYVLLTSDHGEALGEHAYWEHGWSMTHAELHVPLILRWPGHSPPGRRVFDVVRLIDVVPTIVAQLQLRALDGIQGTSLVELLRVSETASPRLAYAERVYRAKSPKQRALYAGDWKLLVNLSASKFELYRYREDPRESQNLADRFPQKLRELRERYEELTRANQHLSSGLPRRSTPLSQETLRRLRSLGYIGEPAQPANSKPAEKKPAGTRRPPATQPKSPGRRPVPPP